MSINEVTIVQHRRGRLWLWSKTNGRCGYCGVAFISSQEMTVDHIVPRTRGGSNDRSNKLACCAACNATKGNRPLRYLRDALQRRGTGRPMFNADQLAYLQANGWQFPAEPRLEFYWERIGNTFPEDADAG